MNWRRFSLAEQAALKWLAGALASIDVAAGLAELAETLDWSRPEVDASLAFAIESGRHPVVEAALRQQGQAFAGNDCKLSGCPAKAAGSPS